MKKILIVEDDRSIAVGLRRGLIAEGFEALHAIDGADGLQAVQSEKPDLLIVDLMMPELNGFELIAELRRLGNEIPVIVLSARFDTKDKVRALGLGADDYVVKPFDFDELVARIKRRLISAESIKLAFGKFEYFPNERLLKETGGKKVELIGREIKLLEFLLRRPDKVWSRDELLTGVWGRDYEGTDRTVDNFIVALRKKIGNEHIQTVRGDGYRFVMKP